MTEPAPVVKTATAFAECDDEHACKGEGEKCQNGHCVGPEPGGPGCRDFGSPTFEFDSPDLSETTSSRGKLDAIGSEESTWQQDRRVDIEVR